MYKLRISFRNVLKSQLCFLIKKNKFCYSKSTSEHFKINKCLIVSKISRYEFECIRHRNLNPDDLITTLQKRENYYEKIMYCHTLHKQFERKVVNILKNMNLEIRIVNRYNYTLQNIEWADVILSLGGDGTFLLAANKIPDNLKPLIGLNSDPNRSEGHLCLPKQYSKDVEEVIKRLKNGKFEWLNRSRIRTTLINHWDNNVKNLHDFQDYELERQLQDIGMKNEKNLPVLALNEVFMGEYISIKMSHMEINLDNNQMNKNIKCYGLCVCTGTGSSSWNLSINRVPHQSVFDLLKLLRFKSNKKTESTARNIADLYNNSLLFPSDDIRMAYTVRDLISVGMEPRGFASKILIKSHCQDAGLVIDGSLSFSFNDGTIAVLEIDPKEALRTVVFKT